MSKPIPCVGFELLYSPVDRCYMENVASLVHSKSNRFIFNVVENLEKGQPILLSFSNNNGPTEYLQAEVTECVQLEEQHYQVTIETQPDAKVIYDTPELVTIPVNSGPSIAQKIFLCCPACKQDTHFKYIANQQGDWNRGILPIYNCESCGTTRAMTGLVKNNV